MGGGGGGEQDTKHLFLPTLYDYKNIGGGTCPCFAVPEIRKCTQVHGELKVDKVYFHNKSSILGFLKIGKFPIRSLIMASGLHVFAL